MKTSLVLLLGALAFAGVSSGADSAAVARTISTVGVAEQEYAPDRAHLFIRLKSVKETFAAARETVNAAQSRLRAEMKRVGLGKNDVAVSARSLRKEYEWTDRKQVYVGQACEQSIEVIVRDLDELEAVTEALAAIDNLELTGVDFRSGKEGEAKRSALLLAAQAAREKAEALAKAAGVRITGLVELVEDTAPDASSYGNRNIVNNLRQINEATGLAAGIANERVRVQVRARYAIE